MTYLLVSFDKRCEAEHPAEPWEGYYAWLSAGFAEPHFAVSGAGGPGSSSVLLHATVAQALKDLHRPETTDELKLPPACSPVLRRYRYRKA